MNTLEQEYIGVIEGMLFLSGDEGLSFKAIRTILNIDEMTCRKCLDQYQKQLNEDCGRGLQLVFLAGKYKLVTKPAFQNYYAKMIATQEVNLSQAALEVLAIIAYNQPITRTAIEEIRGVSSDNVVRKLQARALIKEVGRVDGPGKPILYGVTDTFMDTFNLASLDELPPLEEQSEQEETINIFDYKYKEEKGDVS